MADQGLLFDDRFLERHAGSIITSPAVAIVELIANAWDAYATEVDIIWPDPAHGVAFSIKDNGCGLTPEQFERRWGTLDYNRLTEQGDKAERPSDMLSLATRPAYGRNGRGRHAAFKFATDAYSVRTWRDGVEATYAVSRDSGKAFKFERTGKREGVHGHGTEIRGGNPVVPHLPADEAREIIGARFLADPNFSVSVDGMTITFDDVPTSLMSEKDIVVPGYGTAHLYVIDTLRADRTTRQHGIAWRVKSRLVGACSWVGFNDERILDGRTAAAKRFLFIVSADFLDGAVLPDWSGFNALDEAWTMTRPLVHAEIGQVLNQTSAERRRDAKETVRGNLVRKVKQLSPVGRERWDEFVDTVIDTCQSISTNEVQQIANILANLEIATSQYGLIDKLHTLEPQELDELHRILEEWTVRSAKIALDEIQNRLKLIAELDTKLRDPSLEEVTHLQPLFERSLWVFGPEFESIEYTSNKGMTTVIRELFGQEGTGSLRRADFVVLPDGAVSLFARNSYDEGHEVDGVAHVVIVEIKKVGVSIGSEQKGQPWRYVMELIEKGLIRERTKVTCFVLGSKINALQAQDSTELGGRVVIKAMDYQSFVKRAEARMLGLRRVLEDVPFLQENGFDAEAFTRPLTPEQSDLLV